MTTALGTSVTRGVELPNEYCPYQIPEWKLWEAFMVELVKDARGESWCAHKSCLKHAGEVARLGRPSKGGRPHIVSTHTNQTCALRYLNSGGFDEVCEMLNVEPDRIRALVKEPAVRVGRARPRGPYRRKRVLG